MPRRLLLPPCPSSAQVGGNPAKLIRRLRPGEQGGAEAAGVEGHPAPAPKKHDA